MRIETNAKLVKRNRQIAQYLFFFSFGILILGLFLTNSQVTSPTADIVLVGVIPAIVVIIAFIATIASVRMTNQWVREPRPEAALREGLKGLSNKSVLYNYYHGPVKHVLIAPQGVFAITTRFQDGAFEVNGDDWKTHRRMPGRLMSFFRFDNIGNPTRDAIANVQEIQKLITPIAADVTVQPLIVFTDPRARLEITDPVVPVVHAQDKLEPSLRSFLRDQGRQHGVSLSTAQIQAFEEASGIAGSMTGIVDTSGKRKTQ